MAGCLAVCVGVIGLLIGMGAFTGSPLVGVGIWLVTLVICAMLDSASNVEKLRRQVHEGRVAQDRLLKEIRWAGLTDDQKREANAARERAEAQAAAVKARRAQETREALAVFARVGVALIGIALVGALAYIAVRADGTVGAPSPKAASPTGGEVNAGMALPASRP